MEENAYKGLTAELKLAVQYQRGNPTESVTCRKND